MKNIPPDSLDRRLAQLSPDVPPPSTLWPAIQARMGRPAPRLRPMLMAACVAGAAACLASIFTWAVLRRVQTPDGLPAVASVGTPRVTTRDVTTPLPFREPGDPRYIKAREALQQTFQERLTLLEPSTRDKIEASLAVIKQAHENIRQALLADPSSAVLEELWQSTWHDEFDLYDRVVEATEPSVRT